MLHLSTSKLHLLTLSYVYFTLNLDIDHPSIYRIAVVMVRVLVSSVADRGFEPRSGQTKD